MRSREPPSPDRVHLDPIPSGLGSIAQRNVGARSGFFRRASSRSNTSTSMSTRGLGEVRPGDRGSDDPLNDVCRSPSPLRGTHCRAKQVKREVNESECRRLASARDCTWRRQALARGDRSLAADPRGGESGPHAGGRRVYSYPRLQFVDLGVMSGDGDCHRRSTRANMWLGRLRCNGMQKQSRTRGGEEYPALPMARGV